MPEISVRAKFLRRSNIEKHQNQFRLELPAGYMKLVEWFVKQNPILLESAEIIIRPLGTYSERAIKFFHKLRDEIVKAQSGKLTKKEAERVKKDLKEEFGKGADVSITTYTKRELWELIDGTIMIYGEMPGSDMFDKQSEAHDLRVEAYEEVVDIGLETPGSMETGSNGEVEA